MNGVLRRIIWKLESKRAENQYHRPRSQKKLHTSSFRSQEIRSYITATAFRTSGRVSDRDESVTNLQKKRRLKNGSTRSTFQHPFTAKRRQRKIGTSTRFINSPLTLSNSILSIKIMFSRLKKYIDQILSRKKTLLYELMQQCETNN